MNRLISYSIDAKRAKTAFVTLLLLFCLLPVLINTVVLIPIYSSLEANIVYRGSLISVLIKYVQDFLDVCAFSFAYAMIIFSTLFLTRSYTRLTAAMYTAIFIVQIPLKLLMNVIIYGSLGNEFEITMDIVYLGVYFALQMLQLLIVYIIARLNSDRFKSSLPVPDSKKAINDTSVKPVIPFSRIFDRKNPLQCACAKMALLIVVVKILTRIVNDVTFGAPESFSEVAVMIIYYLSDVIYGAIAYFIALFAVNAVVYLTKPKRKNRATGDKS